jgi:sulfate/thiosulfate transport system permease protein
MNNKKSLGRNVLILVASLFAVLFLLMPLVTIFIEVFKSGLNAYFESLSEPDAIDAIKLTLMVVVIVVPINLIFGVAAAWSVTRFDFPGKTILLTLIDLPFAVSPVISGLIYVLLFSGNTLIGGWLARHGIEVIFAVPGIVIATAFVTLPFIARELIPLMESQGADEEEAAILLGAGGIKTFFSITLPKIKWGLTYGVLLCGARAMGEFGAVSVVSGHIRGKTNTAPLHIEVLYNEYNFVAAFSIASLLALFAVITLIVKLIIERKQRLEL